MRISNVVVSYYLNSCSLYLYIDARYVLGFRWLSHQRKRLSPLSSWVRFSLRTHVKRVNGSAKSRGFSPGAPVSSHRES
jgi:hypothetical protein